MSINNIVFDLGGVLITNDDEGLLTNNQEAKTLLDADQEQLAKGWNKAWPPARDGKIDEDKFFRIFIEEAKGTLKTNNTKSILEMKKIYRKNVRALPAFQLLDSLSKKHRLIALTNITKEWLSYKEKKYKLNKYFKIIVSSCGEGIAKPHAEIFESLINKVKIVPNESLFIDDMERNIKPAQELGFQTILFESKRQLVGQIKKLGVKYSS